MATDSITMHVITCVLYSFFNLSNFSLVEWIQAILVFFAALSAVGYLIYKWIPKSKTKKENSCGKDCGCH